MALRIMYKENEIHVGDVVAVHQKIKEADKERIQVFKGIIIAIRGSGTGKSLTVRRMAADGIGVERIWPVSCPSLVKIQVIKKSRVKRAKLYYLRRKVGREAIKIKALKIQRDEKKEPRKPRRKLQPKVSKK